MKVIEWKNGNHMLFKSSNKIFNRQCDLISPGNVVGAVQFSTHIRPHSEIECNGNYHEPGYLRDFDIEVWKKISTPQYIVDDAMKFTNDVQEIILYKFRHWSGRKEIVDGYVITDKNNRLLSKYVCGPTYKSGSVINEVIPYITV